MAQTIKIKRSTTTAVPSSLTAGELAYSDNSDKLFIGAPADNAVVAIGGKVYIDMLDHAAGKKLRLINAHYLHIICKQKHV